MKWLIKSGRFAWIFLGLLTIIIQVVVPPTWIEAHYSRGLFLNIREFTDRITILFPFPLLYVVLSSFIVLLVYLTFRTFRQPVSLSRKWLFWGFRMVSVFGAGVFFFMLLWGFNYKRVPVETQLQLEPKPLSIDQIFSSLEYHTAIITGLRQGIPEVNLQDTIIPVTGALAPDSLTDHMRSLLVQVLQENGFPVAGKVQCRDLKPEGSLLRFGSSGVYFPFSGEGHIDAALHPLQRPFVIAHEMAHGYGFTDEGICNFWAYLACIHSHNPFVRYVGHLSYWRYLASTYRMARPEAYQKFREKLPLTIQADLNTINENLNQYPEYFSGIRTFIYDTYLKSLGVDEGIENYDYVIPLVTAWWEKLRIPVPDAPQEMPLIQ